MRPEELKETGKRLFRAGQYTDAIPLLKSAVEAFPKDECLWMDLVLAARDSGQQEQAIEFTKQAIRLLPRSDWLWRQLGYELLKTDLLDEAERALYNAHR
ncbi:MAG: tetratricopeptide repeat protein [Candidatus Bathyarchaeota archaeon]|nr:MAG: tetratricopeptide repeat protein [Candidatus Bathyarchaeota archaeon]